MNDVETIPGTRMRVDWQRMISGYNLELPRLPENHTTAAGATDVVDRPTEPWEQQAMIDIGGTAAMPD